MVCQSGFTSVKPQMLIINTLQGKSVGSLLKYKHRCMCLPCRSADDDWQGHWTTTCSSTWGLPQATSHPYCLDGVSLQHTLFTMPQCRALGKAVAPKWSPTVSGLTSGADWELTMPRRRASHHFPQLWHLLRPQVVSQSGHSDTLEKSKPEIAE